MMTVLLEEKASLLNRRGVEWVQKDIKKDIQDFFPEEKNNPNAHTTPPNMYGDE